MARLNTRPSSVGGGRAVSPTPTPSDQENRDPTRRNKNKGRMQDSSRTSLPTPSSDATDNSRGQKRKRATAPFGATQEQDIDDEMDPEDRKFVRYYDPNQNPEQRRQVARKSRALARELNETRAELERGEGDELVDLIERGNQNFKQVKQTGDAALDSNLLVQLSKIATKNADNLVFGDTAAGIDVDMFIAKCVTFMKTGGPPDNSGGTQTQRRRRRAEEEEDEDDGEPLDWEHLGLHACFPYNSRPTCPSFLLGPLSMEKKVRAQTQRKSRNAHDKNAKESRPEELKNDDMAQADENALTAQCTRINKHLNKIVNEAKATAESIEARDGPMDEETWRRFCKQWRMSTDGNISLFEYATNPHSFGQTVENLFYISFLIKEGRAGIEPDANGLPMLIPSSPRKNEEQRQLNVQRNQSVFSIDYATWQNLIEAFEIEEPMIPHRGDEIPQVGPSGWYL